ncbi:MAG: DnaA regulatory inactivator Hda [Gammaproteobacteria bacterium]|jgi:DnaA family protein
MNSPQLPLGLALRDSARFASYYPVGNQEAVSSLQAAAAGCGEALVYVAAAAGLGKTHLLQAACHQAGECQRASAYLPMRDIAADTAAVLPGLERLDLVCLDDIDALAGREEGERALFHLFNRMRESGSVLLVAASAPAQQCGFRLPDLVSRLGWGLTYRLRSLDDGAVLAALLHRARARGLELSEETAVFLLKRIPRDLPTVFSALDRLDEAAMVEQRRLTIPFVKSILNLV